MTSAGLCRANGWKVGDVIERASSGFAKTLRITAIGEHRILAKCLHHGIEDREEPWELWIDGWHKIEPSTKGGEGG